MTDIPLIRHGPWRKKYAMFNEMACRCVEADEEGYPLISRVIEDAVVLEVDIQERPEPPTLLVPYEEFRELVFYIPEFKDLPILECARLGAGEPQYFIAKCFSGTDRQIGDMVLINTEGYDYARYKAPVYAWGLCKTEPSMV
jgi:hypothetical protein